MLCVGAFGVGLWGVSVFCVWESWFGFVGIVCVLCVRAFCVGFWGVCWCCVWESLLWVCGEWVYVVCGRVLCGYVGVCVMCVGAFVVGLWG